jgi:uncharacterized protein (DUF433 family)
MTQLTIQLPDELHEALIVRAAEQNQTADRFVEALLSEQLMPQHPYVEIVSGRGGRRAVVKGTRVGVDTIVGYQQAGYTPRDIAIDILPHLTPAQVYDALSYYEDHRASVDADIAANTPEAWRLQLRQRLGDRADELLGEPT